MTAFVDPSPRVTPDCGLPLPPVDHRRHVPAFDGNGKYVLPEPGTGLVRKYIRASVVAQTLEDTTLLDRWTQRVVLAGIVADPALAQLVRGSVTGHMRAKVDAGEARTAAEAVRTAPRELRQTLDGYARRARIAGGATYAAEFGTAVHAWCEWVDDGRGSIAGVPEDFRPWVDAHRRVTAEHGLTIAPEWVERIVLNTRYGIVGTLDRLAHTHDGGLVLDDIKTSRTTEYSWLYFSVQLACYHGADLVLSLDGSRWEDMPPLADTVLITHLPHGDPDASRIIELDASFGRHALDVAMTARDLRRCAKREGKRDAESMAGLGSIDDDVKRAYLAAYHVDRSRTVDDMAAVWEAYRDVWTDALTERGRDILARNATPATQQEQEQS